MTPPGGAWPPATRQRLALRRPITRALTRDIFTTFRGRAVPQGGGPNRLIALNLFGVLSFAAGKGLVRLWVAGRVHSGRGGEPLRGGRSFARRCGPFSTSSYVARARDVVGLLFLPLALVAGLAVPLGAFGALQRRLPLHQLSHEVQVWRDDGPAGLD